MDRKPKRVSRGDFLRESLGKIRTGLRMKNKTKNKWILTVTSAALLLSGCGKQTTTESQTLTLPIVRGTVKTTITFVGNVTSSQKSELVWRTDGVVENVSVKLGDTVTEGQILATLEEESLSPKVLSAEIDLLDAQQKLEDVQVSQVSKAEAYKALTDKQVAVSDAESYQESLKYPRALSQDVEYYASQMEIQKGYYEDALADYSSVSMWQDPADEFYDLQETKYEKVLSTRNTYAEAYNTYLYYAYQATGNDKNQAAADIDVAKAEYEAAVKSFKTFGTWPREKDVKAAEAAVENAQDTFNRRSIVSDINGTITVQSVEAGDYVKEKDAAFQIDNLDRLFIPLDVSEIDIVEIKDGMKADIVLDANSNVTYEGVVSTVADTGSEDDNRVTFPVSVEFVEPDGAIHIGMTGEVDVVLEERDNVLIVPTSAVYTRNGVSYVMVESEDGESVETEVTPGLSNDTIMEIQNSDFLEGQKIQVPSIDQELLTMLGLDSSYLQQTIPAGMTGMPAVPVSGDASNAAMGGSAPTQTGKDGSDVASPVAAPTQKTQTNG